MTDVAQSSPVKFTPAAVKEIQRLEAQNTDKKLRVGVKGGGCTGLTYVLEYDEPQEDDRLLQNGEVEYLLKKSHAMYLQGVEVDFGTGLDARGFTFTNPNASETCGCGQSFAV